MSEESEEPSPIECCRRQFENVIYVLDRHPDMLDSIRAYAETGKGLCERVLERESQPELPHNHPRRADEMCQCPACKTKDAITYGASLAGEPMVIPFVVGDSRIPNEMREAARALIDYIGSPEIDGPDSGLHLAFRNKLAGRAFRLEQALKPEAPGESVSGELNDRTKRRDVAESREKRVREALEKIGQIATDSNKTTEGMDIAEIQDIARRALEGE